MKKSDAISLEPLTQRHWLGSIWGNALLVLAILGAAWVGYQLEFREKDFRVFLFPGHFFLWHWGAYQAREYELAAIAVIMAVSLQLINGISGQFSLGHAGFMAIGAYLGGYASITYGALDPADESTNFQNVGQVIWYFITLAIVAVTIGAALAMLIMAIRASRRLADWLAPMLMLAVLVWFTWDFSAAFNLDVVPAHFVWTRSLRFLGALFDWSLAHGMPPAKALSLLLPAIVRRPLCFIALLIGGGSFAAAAGLLVGLPTLRLRGDYLAIATLGFAEILRVIFTNSVALGRSTGLSVIPYSNAADPDHDPVAHYIFPWILAIMVVAIVAIWRVAYSPKGSVIRAVREDEIAAAAVGIGNTRQKVTAFIIGAFFAGVGGVLYIQREAYASPNSFGIDLSLLFVVMVTLGGLGSISGAALAAVLLTVIPFNLRDIASPESNVLSDFLGAAAARSGLPIWARHAITSPDLLEFLRKWLQNQNAMLALILIAVMLLRPRGILGSRELWPRRRTLRRQHSAASSAGITDAPFEIAMTPQDCPMATPTATPSEAPASETGLHVSHVGRSFGGLAALKDFSFDLRPGELVGLIGPNGAGKTTAFNVVTGVYKPSGGSILLDGRRIEGLAPADVCAAGIGRTFQNIRLFPKLSVVDNVAVALRRSKNLGVFSTIFHTPAFLAAEARAKHQAMELLVTLNLADKAKRPAESLPYGDQRRLEIARALATGPKILLLDEPAAGMNPQEKVELTRLVAMIRDRFSVGIWLIEHDMKLVMSICQRITVLDHGEMIAVGTPQEVQQNPKVIEAYLGEPVES